MKNINLPKKNKIILVDMDGVLANLDKKHSEVLSELHPHLPRYIPSKRTSYNLTHGYEGFEAEAVSTLDIPGFFADLEPKRGMKKALKEMISSGYTVFICTTPTSTNPTCANDKIHWIRKHLGEYFVDRVIQTKDKTLVKGDFLIDDKPSIDGEVLFPEWQHIVFDAPYNREVKDKQRISVWSEWRDVIEPDWKANDERELQRERTEKLGDELYENEYNFRVNRMFNHSQYKRNEKRIAEKYGVTHYAGIKLG